jgi:hypothetical protein
LHHKFIKTGGIIMKPFRYESEKEPARLALSRRAKSASVQQGTYHPAGDARVSARSPELNGLIPKGYPIAQRSLIQLQQNCGNQYTQRAVKLAQKNEDQMMQTKSLGAHLHRQAEEEPEEEEAVQTKQATGEIQRQPEEEEEEKAE